MGPGLDKPEKRPYLDPIRNTHETKRQIQKKGRAPPKTACAGLATLRLNRSRFRRRAQKKRGTLRSRRQGKGKTGGTRRLQHGY